MPTIQRLTKDQLDALMSEGEFPESVRLAAPKVVVIMTQDWCPQWKQMQTYLPDFAAEAAIFIEEHNLLPDFERIMRYKEDVLGNRQVPYLRFYRDGKLVRETNWIMRTTFAEILK
jgi:glutaredoxin